jgi:hypothetical protein
MCHYSQIASGLDAGQTNTGDVIWPSLSGQTGEALVVGALIAVAWLLGRDHLAGLPAALLRGLTAMSGWSPRVRLLP